MSRLRMQQNDCADNDSSSDSSMAAEHHRHVTQGIGSAGRGVLRSDRADDAPAWLIQRTARVLRVLFTRLVQDRGADVTPEMWTVLIRLLARDGLSQSEIAAATYRDRPNVTRILGGLESRGLVTRRPDPEDRRRVRVYLTPAAHGLIAATAPTAARARDRMHAGLSRERLADLREALRLIEANALGPLEELEGQREGQREAERETEVEAEGGADVEAPPG